MSYNTGLILNSLEEAKKALEQMPICATSDGVWLNGRPDTKYNIGSAMIKINDPDFEKVFRHKKRQWDAALDSIEKAIHEIYGYRTS